MSSLYRKKPVVVEAWRITKSGHNCPVWVSMDGRTRRLPDGDIAITTLEGVVEGRVGDWIIRGVQGELYPIKNDIFEATYESASVVGVVVEKIAEFVQRYNPDGPEIAQAILDRAPHWEWEK